MMNKQYTFALILHLFLCSVCAGQEVEFVSLDFSSPDSLHQQLRNRVQEVSFGKSYHIKVENINRRLFDVETTFSKTNANVSVPTAFASIVLPPYLNFSSLTRPSPAMGKQALMIVTSDLSLLRASINKVNGVFDGFRKLQGYQNHLKRLHYSCGEKWDAVESELFRTTKNFLSLETNDRSVLRSHLKDTITGFLEPAMGGLAIIKSSIEDRIDELEVDLARYALDLRATDVKSTNDSVFQGARVSTEKISRNRISISKLQAMSARIDKALAVYSEYFKTDLVGIVLNNFDLVNESNYAYTSPPFKVDADEVEFSVSVTAKAPITCDRGFEQTAFLKKRSSGGMKIDFSTGVITSFGGSNFFDQKVTFRQVDGNMSVVEIGQAPSALISVGGFAHFYKRSAKKINYALSPGVSTTTNLETVNLHLGGSLLIGFQNRLILTTGLTLKQSTVYDETNYPIGSEHQTGLLPDVPPMKRLFPQAGFFVGVSLNIFRPKEK